MPKLPILTPKQLLKILKQHNYHIDHITDSHYILRNQIHNKIIVVPYHTKDLPKGTLAAILRQAGINRTDLV